MSETPAIWVDFNDRLEDGTWPGIGFRAFYRTGDRVHAYDGEGNCALMDLLTVSDVHDPESYDRIVLHLDMLEWHRESCSEIQQILDPIP